MAALDDRLAGLIPPSQARYSGRFTRDALDGWMQVADPVADEAVLLLREEGYAPDGGQLAELRRLADAGEPAAVAFFARATERPAWLDPELLARARRVPLGLVGLYGLSLLHSLYSGAVFVRSALVTGATGRLGSDPSRRILETTGFVAEIMQSGGLEPGGAGFETTLRVRLLHSSIRYWTKEKQAFEVPYVGEPIDQTMLAMTLGLFSYLNVRSLLRLGVPLRPEDVEAHHHLWRYVGYLLGIDEALLTEDVMEERQLWSALVAHQAFPEVFGPKVLAFNTAAMARIVAPPRLRGMATTLFEAMMLELSGAEFLGVPPRRPPGAARAVLRGVGVIGGQAYYRVPGLADRLIAQGGRGLKRAVEAGRAQGFGVEIESQSDAARAFNRRAGQAVIDRFADRVPVQLPH